MKEIEKPEKFRSYNLWPFGKKLDVLYFKVTNFLPIEVQSKGEMAEFFSHHQAPHGVYRMDQIGEVEFIVEYDRDMVTKEAVVKYLQQLDI